MDRRQVLTLLALAACGGSGPRTTATTTVVARGTLAYAVAFCGDRLATIELAERFELVVRRADGGPPLARADLGAPERDWPALACDATRAWAAGEPGDVRGFDLATGAEVARWPVGAPVTALAAAQDMVAIGDAEGVLCLRRADGALLQCTVAHGAPIAGLVVDGATLVSRDAHGEARGWALPSLAARPAGPPGPRWQGDPVRAVARRVERLRADRWETVATMAGTVRGVAVGPAGTLAVAAWIGTLDQPSVILVRPARDR
jgi:hypothetical protein